MNIPHALFRKIKIKNTGGNTRKETLQKPLHSLEQLEYYEEHMECNNWLL